MNRGIKCLLVAFPILTMLAFSVRGEGSNTAPQDRTPVLVAFSPFETKGDAIPEVARSMSEKLLELLDADSRIEVVIGGSVESPQQRVRYLIKGVVYSEVARRFISLRVLDAKSGNTLWSENYDYTNITADMIAPDIIKALVK